jgi:hypothetical protein
MYSDEFRFARDRSVDEMACCTEFPVIVTPDREIAPFRRDLPFAGSALEGEAAAYAAGRTEHRDVGVAARADLQGNANALGDCVALQRCTHSAGVKSRLR